MLEDVWLAAGGGSGVWERAAPGVSRRPLRQGQSHCQCGEQGGQCRDLVQGGRAGQRSEGRVTVRMLICRRLGLLWGERGACGGAAAASRGGGIRGGWGRCCSGRPALGPPGRVGGGQPRVVVGLVRPSESSRPSVYPKQQGRKGFLCDLCDQDEFIWSLQSQGPESLLFCTNEPSFPV